MFGHVMTTLSVEMHAHGPIFDTTEGQQSLVTIERRCLFKCTYIQPAPSLDFDICHEVNICRFLERSFLYSIQSPLCWSFHN